VFGACVRSVPYIVILFLLLFFFSFLSFFLLRHRFARAGQKAETGRNQEEKERTGEKVFAS